MENEQTIATADVGNRLLERFQLSGIDVVSDGVDDGCFYYDKVCEVDHNGLVCTAKQINSKLLVVKTPKTQDAVDRFSSYCSMLASLRHPHIVQFLGVCYELDPIQSLTIVTERLPTNLEKVLKSYDGLSEEISYSILRDVALGLTYLHGSLPAVCHGELAACNVLLTYDMTAKLADVGVNDLLQLSPEKRKEIGEHTLAHLPPESLLCPSAHPSKAALKNSVSMISQPKVDSYSYGVLIVHTLSGKYPEYLALKASRVRTVSTSTDMDMNRVDEMLGEVSPDHPLSSLALQCLSRTPDLRPTSSQIVTTISGMMLQFQSPSFERRIEILQQILKKPHSRKSSNHERSRVSIQRKDSIVSLSNSLEIEHLKLRIDELQVENRGLRTSIKRQQSIINARDHEMAAKLMAKDQEIISNQEELAAFEATISSYRATISVKEATVHGLTNQLKHLQEYIASKHEPHLLSPKAQLKWRQTTHLPQAMVFAQAVTIGHMVYYGSGTTTISEGDTQRYKIFSYDSSCDKWKPIQSCPVVGFGMANFMDQLTLVGGAYESADVDTKSLTGDVYTYDQETDEYEKSIPAMGAARLLPTVLTYGSTLISCGGVVLDERHDICVSTVEVYSCENVQWYRAEPLPLACTGMSYTTIREHAYFLGGFTDTDFDHPTITVFSVSLQQLVEDALTKSHSLGGGAAAIDSPTPKIWQKFPDSPRYAATATAIGGCLVAVGGSDENLEHKSGALHVYCPLTHSWLRMDDIPVACFSCAVTRLPHSELLIIGGMGHDEEDALKTVFRGRILLD